MLIQEAFALVKNNANHGIRRTCWPCEWKYLDVNSNIIKICPSDEMIKERQVYDFSLPEGCWNIEFKGIIADLFADDWEIVNLADLV